MVVKINENYLKLKSSYLFVEVARRESEFVKNNPDADVIKMPVLYGECGIATLNFEVDAYNKDTKIVIEVEAGRAVTNYQFLKDFFEACCMADAEYLCIAVRMLYGNRFDYQKVCL